MSLYLFFSKKATNFVRKFLKYKMKTTENHSILKKDGVSFVLPFVLVTCCFALWGFANDITNPMVKAFSKIFRMSVTDGSLVQVAFYGGYFCMALPAAIFIRKFSYKAGIMLGLGLYALGALLFLPAKMTASFYPFLIAYFILTCGLSFLETSCNPYILTMGPEESATRRLNMAQAFNPIGSLCGMFVAMSFIQNRLNPLSTEERATLSDADFEVIRDNDLEVLISPYLAIGLVIVGMLVVYAFVKMPKNGDQSHDINFGPTFSRLWHTHHYREGVLAQFCYVGAQIMCWTFIIQYGTRLLLAEGNYTPLEHTIGGLLGIDTSGPMTEKNAEVLSQGYNILAMGGHCIGRFVGTYLLKFLKPGRLLFILGLLSILLVLGVISFQSRAGLYCLVGVSVTMCVMFPTIYGIALQRMGEDAKFGAAGLIMSILGGSVLPPFQAKIIDQVTVWGIPATNVSFLLPLVCFVVIAIYGHRTYKRSFDTY